MKKPCAYCGKPFRGHVPAQRHCSRRCGALAFYRAEMERNPRWTVDAATGCWNWTGPLNNGYGNYRAVFRLYRGERLPGTHIDHLCRNRRCVNPGHMEVVTPNENWRRGQSPVGVNARKTHCKHGHEFTPENTKWRMRPTRGTLPTRSCRTCLRAALDRINQKPERQAKLREYARKRQAKRRAA